MTTHHNIHIIKTQTDLKLTYRDGKFKKIEHLRGDLDEIAIKYLGVLIPPKEAELPEFIRQRAETVIYTSEAKKDKSIFSQFNSAWFLFYRKNNNYIDPKFTGADGSALKQIINYLKGINNNDEAAALTNWQLILDSWDSLSEFHQKQMDLKYINSKLNVIIREIIREKGTNTSGDNSSVSI